MDGFLVQVIILFIVLNYILELQVSLALLDLIVLDVLNYLISYTLFFWLRVIVAHHKKVVSIVYDLLLRSPLDVAGEAWHVEPIVFVVFHNPISYSLIVVSKEFLDANHLI